MSALQDIPNYASPIEVLAGGKTGRFTNNWLDWFIKLGRAMQDKQSELPINSPGIAGVINGPGPVDTNLSLVLRRRAIVTVTGFFVQSFVTSAPAWAMNLFLDTQSFSTGTVADWQPVVCITKQFLAEAGTHNVACEWVTSTANGRLTNILVSASFAYI